MITVDEALDKDMALSDEEYFRVHGTLNVARIEGLLRMAVCANAWEDAPDWQKSSAVNGVEYHVAHPEAGPQHSHECWLAEKRAAGWKWGPEKSGNEKEHPCMVPFDELPKEQQAKDFIFRAVVHALS